MTKKFSGKLAFLSNMYQCDVEYRGNIFLSSESAYQSAKFDDSYIKYFKTLDGYQSKSFARKLKNKIITNWDDIKLSVMEEILRNKFKNKVLLQKLKDTNNQDLVELNSWHDNFWGNCICPKCKDISGENNLGKILRKIKEEL